jgi:hypothetical protein
MLFSEQSMYGGEHEFDAVYLYGGNLTLVPTNIAIFCVSFWMSTTDSNS